MSGCPVELQVRTYMQDLWAQVVERLGDVFGRSVRYGDVPAQAAEVMEQVQNLSARIAQHEDAQALIEVVEQGLPDLDVERLDNEARAYVEAFPEHRDRHRLRGFELAQGLEALRDVLLRVTASDL